MGRAVLIVAVLLWLVALWLMLGIEHIQRRHIPYSRHYRPDQSGTPEYPKCPRHWLWRCGA